MAARRTNSTKTYPPTAKDWDHLLDFLSKNDTGAVRRWFNRHQIPGPETLGSQVPQYFPDPVYQTVSKGNLDVFDLLVQHGFKTDRITYRKSGRSPQPIHIAASLGHLEIVKKLINECDISVDAWDNSSKTPLMYAVTGIQTPIVKYLLSKGADVNYCPSGMAASLPLSLALSSNNNTELAGLLLQHGADINRDTQPEGCLLNRFVGFDNLSVVEWLYNNGARTDIYGSESETAFHYAMNPRFNIDMIKFLIGINVPLNHLTSEGHTAFDGVLCDTYSPELPDCLKLILDAGFRVTQKDYGRACQIWITDTDLLLVKQLESYLSHPRSLQQLCCFSIREILGIDLPKRVEDLPVPNTIKEYIRLDHLVNS